MTKKPKQYAFPISTNAEVFAFCEHLRRSRSRSRVVTEIIQASRQFKKWLQTRR